VLMSCDACTLVLLVSHSSSAQPRMPSTVIAEINNGQKLLVKSKSLIFYSSILFKRQIGRFFEIRFAPA